MSCVQFILFHIQILYSKYHAALFVKCFTYIDLGNYIPKIYLDLYLYDKYVVKHKSAKLFMTYAVGKLEVALNISHLILSMSSQRVS